MPQYMLLLYDDPSGWQHLSPEEMQKALEKYMAWGQKPFMKGSERLAPDVFDSNRLWFHAYKPSTASRSVPWSRVVLRSWTTCSPGSVPI